MAQEFTEQRFDYSGGRATAPELIVMVGASGSGKSVLARKWVFDDRGATVRVNRDSIRAMLYCDVPWKSSLENLTRDLEKEAARQALQRGQSVIVDDTNCVRQTRFGWEKFAQETRVRLRFVRMTTDIKTCIERDSKREGKERVGEDVIRKQWRDLNEMGQRGEERAQAAKLTRPYFERQQLLQGGFLPRLPGCPWVLFDVDGTLAKHENVRGPFEEHKVLLDEPYEFVIEIMRALRDTHNICVVSGRHDWCGDDTCDWLDNYQAPFDHILMRHSGDNRSDAIVKKEILDELAAVVGKENIAYVFDDRPRVVQMWRENGVRVIPVRGGTDHTDGCEYAAKKGYKVCPDCGALEYF